MVDLDSGVQYSLFRAPDIARFDGFQISFKEGVRSSFWVALYNGVKQVTSECSNSGPTQILILPQQ